MSYFRIPRQAGVLAVWALALPVLTAQTPSIASWNPYHAPVGGVVTIAGSNLNTVASVYFNGVAGSNLQIQSAWGLSVTVPAGAATGPVKVVNPAGAYTASVNFTVDGASSPAPSISSYSPSKAAAGAAIAIAGSYLSKTTSVSFNGTAAAFTVVSDWSINATVPAGASTGPIQVATSGGTYKTSTNFTVIPPPPGISSWSPYHAPVGGSVSIQGKNLQTTSGVTFNGVAATSVVVNSDWGVTAVVPNGASTGPVTITTLGGSYTAGSNFTVDGPAGSSTGSGSSSGSPTAPAPVTSSGFINPPASDPPGGVLAGHPRIFIRQQDLPRLQGWAVSSNPIWNDLLYLGTQRKAAMDSGALNGDSGDGDAGFIPIETDAEFFAFMALLHPDAATRADYTRRAHDLVMTVINQAALGAATGQPYRDPMFSIGNRASWYGEAFPCVVDWLYNSFTAAEKASIRAVFLRWIQENLNASSRGDHPQPAGVVNDPSLVSKPFNVRVSTNNYYANHARQVGLMAMVLDAADDVPAGASDPPSGTLRRFVGNAIGAWLYVQNQYENTSGAGGIEPEGMGYGELSLRGWAFLLLAMHTTGTDNPFYGVQANAITNSYWTQDVMNGYLNMVSPGTVNIPGTGPSYRPYSFGDFDKYQVSDAVRVFGPLAIYAINTNNAPLYGKARWMVDNLPPGGLPGRDTRIQSTYSYSGAMSPAIFYFLACDPNSAGVDPRPALPPDYFAPGTGVLLSRTGWTAVDAWFTYKLSWNAIDHQHGDGNAIGFFRGGEWMTMPASGYGVNIGSSDYQNTLAIQNPVNTANTFWSANMARGSQWEYDPNGDPSVVTHNSTPAYTYAQGDATNLYNNPAIAALDVQHASRSVLWLKPDVIVVYDRATTGSGGKFKRFYLNTPALATVNGKSATVATPGGQTLYVDALLPASATVAAAPRESMNEAAAGDPVPFRLWTEDLALPADVRFLHVLQAASAGVAKQAVSPFSSSSGTPFDGAVVGNTAVLFRRDIAATFTGITFSVPAGAHTYITGLTPGASYSVSIAPVGGVNQVTIMPEGGFVADAGGVIAF